MSEMSDIVSTVQFTINCIEKFSEEVSLISGVKEDVESIGEELKSMLAMLSSADKNVEENETVNEWVKQVRKLAYEIEDAMDEYKLIQNENTVFGKMKQYIGKRSIANTIKSLREKAAEINRRKETYRFNAIGGVNSTSVAVHQFTADSSACVYPESDLVGAEVAKGEVIDLLDLQELQNSERCPRIAVIGMNGLGKTSVVRSVFSDGMVRDYFPIRAWIFASEASNRVEIVRRMIKQFYQAANEHEQPIKSSNWRNTSYFDNASRPKTCTAETRTNLCEINSMDETSLQSLVRTYLKDKRYMVVIDGVQEGHTELAKYLKQLLPTKDSNGSKILMTTRYENVARIWVDGHNRGIYNLKPLVPSKAWELFCKKAFQCHNGACPPLLENLARDIVRRCGGVPLLVSEMGRFLSAKSEDLHEWKKVHDSLGFYLQEQDLEGVYGILIPSFQSLPQHLKSCLLYFGLFPIGHPVDRMRLIRLWIAEGFIEGGIIGQANSSKLTLEEVAEEYIKYLVDRSLVEVQHTEGTGKPILRVNEFLHEIIISKAKELGFCQTLPDKNPIITQPRRVSLHVDHNSNTMKVIAKAIESKSNIKSLLLLTEPRAQQKLSRAQEKLSRAQEKLCCQALSKALNNNRLLKVVDFCNASFHELPKEIEKLHNLHYLSVKNTRIEKLPSSICKLQYLQTLDLKQTCIEELPIELSKLHKLCHLLAYRYEYDVAFSIHAMKTTGVKVPEGALEKLEELQKLAFVDVGHRSKVVKELRNLKQLRRLGITRLKLEDGKDLCDAVVKMEYLQSFSVYSYDTKQETIDLDHFESSPPLALKRLYLNGPLMAQRLPSWTPKLHSLVKIRLRWSCLNFANPLEILETLPNLVELQLLEAYLGNKLKIGAEGFKKLKTLHLLNLLNLESLSICKGALPLLELMAIGESPKLSVPVGIKYLPRLETLNLFNMPMDFARSLQPDGKYHYVVKHVPHMLYQQITHSSWDTKFL